MPRFVPRLLFLAALFVIASSSALPSAQAAELTPAQLAGQRIVYAFQGTTAPPGLVTRIGRGEAGAVILFAGNITSAEQGRELVASLQDIPRPRGLREPLLVMVDQEGGPVRRAPGGPEPSAAELGASNQPVRAEAAGRAAGNALNAIGANVNLAPVVDVPRPGTVIERQGRAFSREPDVVAKLAAAYLDGLWVTGIAGAAKHFPGLGAAPETTDEQAVALSISNEQLRKVDERPFIALIEREIPLIMLSTAVYQGFEPVPAALSRQVATTELRRRLGFRGASVADALDTPALTAFGNETDTAVAAARAGTDLMIYAKNYRSGDRAARGLASAIARGEISERDVRLSMSRVMALRQGFVDDNGLARVQSPGDAWATTLMARELDTLVW